MVECDHVGKAVRVIGADVEALERLAESCVRAHRLLGEIAALGDRPFGAASWVGVRAAAQRVAFEQTTRSAGHLGERYRRLADELAAQAASQRRASSSAELPSSSTPALAAPPANLAARLDRFGDIVAYDPSGQGSIVVAHSATSENAPAVAIFVPGTGASVANAERDLRRGQAIAVAAGAAPGSEGAAVYTWIDASLPDAIWAMPPHGSVRPADTAVSDAAAVVAAERLAQFVRSLDLHAAATITLIGHSYGSLVVTAAAQHLGRVDNVVLVGSPGAGRGMSQASDIAATHVYSLATADDLVAQLDIFGARPGSNDFGAYRLPTKASAFGTASAGHSGYFEEGTSSLNALGRISAGLGPPPVYNGGGLGERAMDAGDRLVGGALSTLGAADPIRDRLEDTLGADHPLAVGLDHLDALSGVAAAVPRELGERWITAVLRASEPLR